MVGEGLLIGESAAFRRALAEADRLARTSLPLVLYGPSGTGKESFARRIHDQSKRAGGPFVVIDCTKLPRELIESTLFGHERGAFTGAVAARPGLFELADGGTAFLDEVAELPVDQQVKLLRVLQEGEVQRVGASKPRIVDVRIVAATNRNLAEMVKRGEFREDLYYRLVGDRIALPPLSQRGRDVIAIGRSLVERVAPGKRLTGQAEQLLLEYDWPGNVRQLQNVIEATAARTTGARIEREALWRQIRRITHFVPVDTTAVETSGPAELRDAVLELIESGRATTMGKLQAALRIRKAACYEVLAELESTGLIARQGRGRGTHYVALASATPGELTRRQREILKLLRRSKAMTVGELLGELAQAPAKRTLRDDLHRLKLLGAVTSRRRGRQTEWLLAR